jgi:hypothetical protein
MKNILVFSLLVIAVFCDYRSCTEEKCAAEVSACEKHLTCLTKATGCWTKCG